LKPFEFGVEDFFDRLLVNVRHDFRVFLLPFKDVALGGPALRAELMPPLHLGMSWPAELVCSSILMRDWVGNLDSREVMVVQEKRERPEQRTVLVLE
tara:strand:- start:800 stop:1090 length:291 start_codon:yes stop_codon:yes gene_type:complete